MDSGQQPQSYLYYNVIQLFAYNFIYQTCILFVAVIIFASIVREDFHKFFLFNPFAYLQLNTINLKGTADKTFINF